MLIMHETTTDVDTPSVNHALAASTADCVSVRVRPSRDKNQSVTIMSCLPGNLQ